MDRNEDGTPEALRKLFSILNIMALDIECLSCNKVRPSFLQDMKRRMSGNVCKNYHRISRKLAVKAQQGSYCQFKQRFRGFRGVDFVQICLRTG